MHKEHIKHMLNVNKRYEKCEIHMSCSFRSRVLFMKLNFLNLAPLWVDPSSRNKCVSLLYFHHEMSREILSKFNFTCSCDHL